MYMSRIRLLPDASKSKVFWNEMSDAYQVHHLLWSLFSCNADQKRDFLYLHKSGEENAFFYSVSERIPEDKDGVWNVESKEYNPSLYIGQRLAFSLCANPICTKRDDAGKQHRHDVVMNAKNQLKLDGVPKKNWPLETEIVQDHGFKWLAKKGDQYGFGVEGDKIQADGYRQERFYKAKGKHGVNISTIDFTGLLTVTDPVRFKQALFHGIGPAKGFGCGLLLVRPVC